MKTSIKSINLRSTLNKNIALSLVVFCSCINSSYAETEIAGKTLLAKGSVNAINSTTKESRVLKRRSKIFSVEHIVTGENSKAQFSMADGGLITLKENTEINVSHYTYNKESKKGSATLEVISGGLRSISGLIKKTGGDYQVKTPVGSIGIRGTHFAVEVVGDKVFFGVFSGNIDIKLNNNEILSLGVTEGFAFASVNELGNVTPLTQAPAVLSQGYATSSLSSNKSSKNTPSTDVQSTNNQSIDTSSSTAEASSGSSISNTESVNIVLNSNTTDETISTELYTESQWQDEDSLPIIDDEPIIDDLLISELISERSGTFNYQQLTQSDVTSSAGSINNFTMNMAINFDNGTVPGGSLSLTDAQGEWFATYSGLINIDQLELGINFASHANKRADGDISAVFTNGLDELTGNFELHEIEDTTIKANGSFKIR